MVTFVCYYTDKTLKKKQVERHMRECPYPLKICCIGNKNLKNPNISIFDFF